MAKKERDDSFDEAFKILMKQYFSQFAEVKTDFEILSLPKKVDLLIIETNKPIIDYVSVFTYFKKTNIIEFKSELDRFRFIPDVFDLGLYINGILKELNIVNFEDKVTFSLVSSYKPVKLLKFYNDNVVKVRNGVYRIDDFQIIPVWVIVIEELPIEFQNELMYLKEFTTKKDIEEYLIGLFTNTKFNYNNNKNIFKFATSLHKLAATKIKNLFRK